MFLIRYLFITQTTWELSSLILSSLIFAAFNFYNNSQRCTLTFSNLLLSLFISWSTQLIRYEYGHRWGKADEISKWFGLQKKPQKSMKRIVSLIDLGQTCKSRQKRRDEWSVFIYRCYLFELSLKNEMIKGFIPWLHFEIKLINMLFSRASLSIHHPGWN